MAAKKALVQLSGPLAAPVLAEDFPRRPMRSLVIIKCDGARQPPLAYEPPPEKLSAAATSRLVRKQEVDALSVL